MAEAYRCAWLLAALVACLLACTSAHAIINGFQDTGNVYANVGVYIVVEKGTGSLVFICSGALIDPRVFLTAAHCVRPPPGADVTRFRRVVSFSPDRALDPTTWIDVVEHRGPPFSAVPFAPGLTASTVGNGTLTFSDASSGRFAYTAKGVSQSKPITRFLFAAPAGTVCQ